jgi:cell shape-determining protein MreD
MLLNKIEVKLIASMAAQLLLVTLPFVRHFLHFIPDIGLLLVTSSITLSQLHPRLLAITICGVLRDLFYGNYYMITAAVYILLYAIIKVQNALFSIHKELLLIGYYLMAISVALFLEELVITSLSNHSLLEKISSFSVFFSTLLSYLLLYLMKKARF